MSKRYAIWDKVSDIYTPVGERLTADQWIVRYGWIKAPSAVPVVAAGLINGALIDELGQMKKRYEQQGATFDSYEYGGNYISFKVDRTFSREYGMEKAYCLCKFIIT